MASAWAGVAWANARASAVHGFVYSPDSAGHQMTVPTALLHQALVGAPVLAARLD